MRLERERRRTCQLKEGAAPGGGEPGRTERSDVLDDGNPCISPSPSFDFDQGFGGDGWSSPSKWKVENVLVLSLDFQEATCRRHE